MPPKKPAPKSAKVKPLDFLMPEEKSIKGQMKAAQRQRAFSAMPAPGPVESRAQKRWSRLLKEQTSKYGKAMPTSPQADKEYRQRGGSNSAAIADREYSKRLAAGKEKVAASEARLSTAAGKIKAKASKPAKLPDYGLPGTVSKPASKAPASRPAPAPKAPAKGGLPPAKLNARAAGGLPGTVSKKAAGEAKLDRLIGPRNPGRGGLPSSGGMSPMGGGGGGGGPSGLRIPPSKKPTP